MKNDWHTHQEWFSAQTAHQCKSIDIWHENVGNDQVWEFSAGQFQSLSAIIGFKKAMAKITEQCHI
jgi:hypothetical protein